MNIYMLKMILTKTQQRQSCGFGVYLFVDLLDVQVGNPHLLIQTGNLPLYKPQRILQFVLVVVGIVNSVVLRVLRYGFQRLIELNSSLSFFIDLLALGVHQLGLHTVFILQNLLDVLLSGG